MEELYECSMCGQVKRQEDFETDFGTSNENDMTCEACYNEMDEDYTLIL